MSDLEAIQDLIPQTMRWDRHRLRDLLRAVQQRLRSGQPFDRLLERLAADVERSARLLDTRRRRLPAIAYPQDLPVSARRAEIAETIDRHQVLILCGETGSGKSTQLPKICLESGRGVEATIGHTQPRRIAARSVAARVAEELGTPLGQGVGYKVRFAEQLSEHSYIKVMTDGILLAELQGDSFLSRYDTIIVDEAHERSLNIDFLLGHLKNLLPRRRDLKLIITSATIDAARFARHFGTPEQPAPVIEVAGRTYPVEVRYRPAEPEEETGEPDWTRAACAAVEDLAAIDLGDMLVFMPTERDIHETAKLLRGRTLRGDRPGKTTEILPLYGRLSIQEQQRIFQPHPHRRIVIATNVAESSLTVPGVRYVVDPGTARISRYAARSRTQRLPIEPISQASADQRKGRCGRVGPGVCVRLYSEDDYLARERFTPPEIQRTDLAAVILQTKAFRLGDIETFPFLEPPRPEAVRDGYKTLFELGALDADRNLTEIGRQMSRMPVDPRTARMILGAAEEDCLHEALIIAAALELQDPRERPIERQEKADEAHAQFLADDSDFLGYLKLWDFYQRLKGKLSRNQLRKACAQNFLSYNRMREWADIHLELLELVAEAGLKPGRRRDSYDAIHRAILTGCLSSIALRSEKYEYTATGGGKFRLWPGSALFDAKPTWIVAAEMVETTGRYLRCCAKIDPRWIEPLAGHLVERSYSDLRWESRSASAVATERVSLFGLVIVPGRRVAYGPIDPEASRQVLIQHGLVEGAMSPKPDFLQHNEQLYRDMEQLQAKLRRSDLLLGEWARYEFYDRSIPADVYDGHRLRQWLRKIERRQPRLPYMRREDLVRDDSPQLDPQAFPTRLEVRQTELPLEYHFEPGAPHDGVTLTVPIELLNQLEPSRLGWLVPGMIQQKVVAMIRALPKDLRRPLVPVPDTARKVLAQLRFGEGDFVAAVARALGAIAGAAIPVAAFQADKMPGDAQMNVRVVDADGKPLAEGRDLDELRRQLGVTVAQTLAAIDDSRFKRDGLTAWDFEELPEHLTVRRGGLELTVFPALVDAGTSVALRLMDSPEAAAQSTRAALRRLFMFVARRDLRTQAQWLPDHNRMLVYASGVPQLDLDEELIALLADRAVAAGQPLPRNRAEFDALIEAAQQRIAAAAQDVAKCAPPIFPAYHQARLAIEKARNPHWEQAIGDARQQLASLVHPTFLSTTPWNWLLHYPRYLRAIAHRIERLSSGSLARDTQHTREIRGRWEAYLTVEAEHARQNLYDPALVQYRWMLEELRVSLFAQKLGTALPVSLQRIDRLWAEVRT